VCVCGVLACFVEARVPEMTVQFNNMRVKPVPAGYAIRPPVEFILSHQINSDVEVHYVPTAVSWVIKV
jgi:hypothetical protein